MSHIPFELKSIDLVADWNYNCLNNECRICGFSLYKSNDIWNKGNNCNVFRYECKYAFHQKCIKKWLKKNNNCPVGNCEKLTFDTNMNMQSNIKLFKK